MKQAALTRFTKYMLDFMFYSGILVCILLPWILKLGGKFFTHFQIYYVQLLILLFISGVFAVLIIYELRRMFQTVLSEDCFVKENVQSLKRMGTYSFCISAATCLRLIMVITPATLVVILVFIIAGLFSKVLASVFETAIAYKLENDLTI